MLHSIKIENYRGFRDFQINDLGRVNLLVGKNNCGKTTILEAAELLLTGTHPMAVMESSLRRGELIRKQFSDRPEIAMDINNLVYQRKVEDSSSIHISGLLSEVNIDFKCNFYSSTIPTPTPIDESSDADYQDYLFENDDDEMGYTLEINHSFNKKPIDVPVSKLGWIFRNFLRKSSSKDSVDGKQVIFIRPEALDSFDMNRLWDNIALTNEEERVLYALKILEPAIERIAFLSDSNLRYNSGGIFIKLKDINQRIPLGSLGDGIKHILSISMALSHAKGSYVMIDEIDSGLHYSTMKDMWKVLIKTAKRLDVQVFATTHSQDCLDSLAQLHKEDNELSNKIKLFRIEKEKSEATAYSAQEVLVATQQDMELRGW